jgi:pimeloyl-ACP methyl ester carboxylesterase
MDPLPLSLTLAPDCTLAALAWGSPASPLRVLAAHGWMDNAATFSLVAPALVSSLGAYVVAVDLPGHGMSSHKAPRESYSAIDYAAAIVEAADALGWGGDGGGPPFVLLGHSLGGGLCTVVAASFPTRVSALVLLENLGLSHRAVEEAPDLFAKAVLAKRTLQQRRSGGGGGGGGGSVYASVADAVAARVQTARTHPGAQSITPAAAERLVRRALVEAPLSPTAKAAAGAEAKGEGATAAALGFTFRHDKRIIAPALLSASEDQVLAFLSRIACPTLVVTAENGWPFSPTLFGARMRAVGAAAAAAAAQAAGAAAAAPAVGAASAAAQEVGAAGAAAPAVGAAASSSSGAERGNPSSLAHVHLPGSHHHHLDDETAPAVIEAVVRFLRERGGMGGEGKG